MTQPRLIVCERTNQWAVALRWALSGSGIRVYETRRWTDCWQELASSPSTLLALELRRTNLAEIVRGLVESHRCYPQSGAVVLARRELRDCEWILREAGALQVIFSPRDLSSVVRLAHHFCEQPSPPAASFHAWVWDRMPWKDLRRHQGPTPDSTEAPSSTSPTVDLPPVGENGTTPR